MRVAYARRASAAGELASSNGHGTRERHTNVEVRRFIHLERCIQVLSHVQPHCEMCHKKDRGEEMLLCDGCDCGEILMTMP